jgi:cytosine/adenosine deaminase-related metal-dependent hydrolase
VTIDDELTQALGSLWQARNEYETAKRRKEKCERQVMQLLTEAGLKGTECADLHFTVTAATRRSAKVAHKGQCMAALNEIGLVLPMKEAVDTTELLAIADRYGGDFPGVLVTETPYLMVKGKER